MPLGEISSREAGDGLQWENRERQSFCLFVSDEGFLAWGGPAATAVSIEVMRLFF